ncbi:MAG: hypothetical protein R3D62_06605 [Xanthobacteraceae bacterium]
MSEGDTKAESTLRTVLITYFPMAIAVLSLCTSMVGSYLNSRFIDFVERNAGRVEYMHTCKDIIDAYFQVKLRANVISTKSARAPETLSIADEIDGQNAVSRFAALGTYLANLRDEDIRARYTDLSRELERVMREAKNTPAADLPQAFSQADEIFAEMNADCVKPAKDMRM